MGKRGYQDVNKHSQLCWYCDKAGGKCSWSRDFTPVQGWKAKPTKVPAYTTGNGKKKKKIYLDSFEVHECPEFEPLKLKDEAELIKLIKRNSGRIRRDQDE